MATGVTPPPHQLRLQGSTDFGSKVGDLSRKAPRVRCPTHVGSAGGANFTAARPTFPIFAHLCPFLPFNVLAPFGHTRLIGFAFRQNFLIGSFGCARCPYAGHYRYYRSYFRTVTRNESKKKQENKTMMEFLRV